MESWRHVGRQLFVIGNSSAWWIGDWLVYGRRKYPDRYREAINETSLDYQTLRNYAWVAGKFEMSRRRDKLTLQHHAAVAALPEPEQDYWLDQAEQEGWSATALRGRVREARKAKQSERSAAAMAIPLRIRVTAERRQQWEEAAGRSGQHLLDWMFLVLDQAAAC